MHDDQAITLSHGSYELVIAPAIGGSLQRFVWNGMPVFREAVSDALLHAASFPLVPFCNRIAHGRFTVGERMVALSSNFPGKHHPHTLHGYGWVNSWTVAERGSSSARLVQHYDGAEWPWRYTAEQVFHLTDEGLWLSLAVTNHGPGIMPAGLGFHPYFPLVEGSTYFGRHSREWHTSSDGLPVRATDSVAATDWWYGAPVQTRVVDTVYEGRCGSLRIRQPKWNLEIELLPSDTLPCTGVYVEPDAGFFCVGPLSHATDAINRQPSTMTLLSGGETMQVHLQVRVLHLPQTDN